MGNNKLLQVLVSYKKACALMAAFDLGVYEKLLSKPTAVIELAEKCHADEAVMGCFLEYLRAVGIVEEKDGYWSVANDFSGQAKDINSYRNIIEHEKNIYKQWVTPAQIMTSVQNGIGHL